MAEELVTAGPATGFMRKSGKPDFRIRSRLAWIAEGKTWIRGTRQGMTDRRKQTEMQ
jgi:hypothetical protein